MAILKFNELDVAQQTKALKKIKIEIDAAWFKIISNYNYFSTYWIENEKLFGEQLGLLVKDFQSKYKHGMIRYYDRVVDFKNSKEVNEKAKARAMVIAEKSVFVVGNEDNVVYL